MKRSIRKKKNGTVLDEVFLEHIWGRLEAGPDSEQLRRVRRILDLLLDLKEQVGTLGALPVLTALRELIDRFTWVSEIAVTSTDVRVGMRGVGKLSQDDLWEYGAVRTLLDLVQKPKGLSLLRRCPMCPKVFVANNRGRRRIFCTDACKMQHEYADPVKRANKLKNMRANYAMLSDLQRNPKSGVGLNRKAKKRKVKK